MTRTDQVFIGLGAVWFGAFALLASSPLDTPSGAAERTVAHSGASADGQVNLEGLSLPQVAREGDIDAVHAFLAAGEDVDATEADGSTALHWAVYNENHDAMRALIAAGADVAKPTREGSTPLSLAAINGDADAITLLLEAGAEVDERLGNGETPLMFAARTGEVEAIEVLLDAGADVNAQDSLRETTPLMWAAANTNTAAVRLLLEHGADYSMRSGSGAQSRGPYLAPTGASRIRAYKIGYTDEGLTDEVSEVERLRARASLLDQEASERLQEIAREEQSAEIADIFSQVEDPDSAEEEEEVRQGRSAGGLTALVFATREGDMETVKALVEAGADVNQTTAFDWTPLLTAVQNRYYKIAAYLLEQGADPNIANGGGWTPLYIATDNRNIEGGDYPTRRPDMDHMELIRMLLDNGADPNMRMASSTETRTVFTNQWLHEEGATAFLRAAQSSDMELMELLLEHGADPNIPTEAGITPLMVAAGIGWVEGVTYETSPETNVEVVEWLIELGNDVNAQEHVDGRTALIGAAHKGRNEVIQILVDNGADLSMRDFGSRDSIHELYGKRWLPIDYAEGLVRVGVQSAVEYPETAALLRRLMRERGLEPPPEGRTFDSICIVEVCQPPT